MSFQRYAEYKDSEIPWTGVVPTHWKIDRLKRSIASCRNGIWGDEAKGDENDIPCVRVADFDRQRLRVVLEEPTIRNVSAKERETRLLSKGNLLLEKSGGGEGQPVGCVVLYDDAAEAICSNFVARVELADDMDSSFWRYVHASAYSVRLNVASIKQTSGIQNLDQQSYFDERVAFPPLDEQAAIGNFLDRETAKIDALVAEQEKLIALLKEKRQALISHAVTKGLDPNVPMKDSGVEWLGQVPAHWKICALRRIVKSIEQGWSPDCFSRPADGDEWGVLKAGCVNRGKFDEADNKALPREFQPVEEYEVRAGDVLMSRASGSPELVGSTAFVRQTRSRLMLSDKIFRLRLGDEVDPEFFVASLNARALRSQIEIALSGGNGFASNLPQSMLLDFFMCVPPIKEQRQIALKLDNAGNQLESLTTEAERAIDLLKERRNALISAAVTGKIDVRGFAPADSAGS